MKPEELMIGDYVIRKNVPKEILMVDAIDSIRGIVYLDLVWVVEDLIKLM